MRRPAVPRFRGTLRRVVSAALLCLLYGSPKDFTADPGAGAAVGGGEVGFSVGDSGSTRFSRISHLKSRVLVFVLQQIQARNLEPALRWVEEKQDALSAAVAEL